MLLPVQYLPCFVPEVCLHSPRSSSGSPRITKQMAGPSSLGSPLKVLEFNAITREICKLPTFFSSVIFRKIDANDIGFVTRDAFVDYWVNGNFLTMDTATQLFRILKQPDNKYLTRDDFKPGP